MFGWITDTIGSLFGSTPKLDRAVEELVLRARAGDQNAIATIVLVRRNSRKGGKKAQKTYQKLMVYCKRHPFQWSPFGSEKKITKQDLHTILHSKDPTLIIACMIKCCRACPSGYYAACVTLANGPMIDSLRVTELASGLNAGQEKAFRFGAENPLAGRHKAPPTARAHMALGQLVRHAQGIQVVRSGGSIAALSPDAARELGDRRPIPGLGFAVGVPREMPLDTGNGNGTSAATAVQAGASPEPVERGDFYSPEEQELIADREGMITQGDDDGPPQDVMNDLMRP